MTSQRRAAVLTIGLLQMTPAATVGEAIAKAERFCRDAHRQGADIVVFPELWSEGYHRFAADDIDARGRFLASAISPEGDYVRHFQRLAAELGMAIVPTLLEAHPGGPRNSALLIDASGEIRLHYAKVHTCDFSALEACCTPGERFGVATIRTAVGDVRVGLMICYDREHPESARLLMLQGAEVILVPNACTLDEMRIRQVQVRGFENAVAVAVTNYASPHMNGRSVAVDATGALVAEAADGEGVILAQIDLAALREHRNSTIWGNAWRRPQRYGLLTDPAVAPPFVRTDALGRPFDRRRR